jgi:hypothetical protein
MRDWFEAQLAAGLPAFTGTVVSGTLAVKQEAVSELVARWLAASSGQTGAIEPPPLDLVRRWIKTAAVRAEQGTVYIDFEIGI